MGASATSAAVTVRSRAAHTPAVARPRSGRAVAWVESPLQLLGAVEAHSAGLLGRATTVYTRAGVRGMDTTVPALPQAPAGFRIADVDDQPPSPQERLLNRWVTGDAFSGKVQRHLLRRPRTHELVILDDGLATLHLLRSLVADRPQPLVRHRSTRSGGRIALGTAAWWRLRELMRARELLVFTALPVAPALAAGFQELGGKLERHRFEWLSSRPVLETVPEPTVLVGSAMPADGLIDADAYVRWVHAQASDGALAYFPHRRETDAVLERIDAHPRINLRRHTVPIEMRLRGLSAGQTVRALPSTALSSLRLLLDAVGVPLHGYRVPEHWWTSAAERGLRDHLNESVPPSRTAS